MKLFSWLTDLLLPARCALCGEVLADPSADLCPDCRLAEMVIPPTPFKIVHVKEWVALWGYRGNVRKSLGRFKFGGRTSYAVPYGRELALRIQNSGLAFDVLSWVPVSPLRRHGRGYDQVELVAREVAARLGRPLVPTLRKHRHNRRQSRIQGYKARRKNVQGVYRAVDPERFRGKRVLLLEDIVTTGATLEEAARTLRQAGARQVLAAAVAAVPRS